jgi:acetyl esterase
VTVEVELTEAPDPADLGSPTAVCAIVGWLAPLRVPAGATDLKRSVYNDGGQQLWAYGRADAADKRPGVVFVHGGGWGGGEPGYHLRHAHDLAARGYVTALVEYRLTAAGHTWPAALDDVLDAVAWLRANAEELGLDPDRLAIAGGSAGGHLAAMASLDRSARLAAAVLWYPAVDLRVFDAVPEFKPMTDALLPGATGDDLLAASPLAHVRADGPPTLTMTGDLDPCTTLSSIEEFHAALDAAGVDNRLVVFKGRDHGFDFHPADWQVCFDRMAAFLDGALGG